VKFLLDLFGFENKKEDAGSISDAPATFNSDSITSSVDIQQIRYLASMSTNSLFVPYLIDFFVKDSALIVEQIQKELSAGNVERVQHLLHSLKGAAMGIGAKNLMDVCVELGKLTKEEVKNNSGQIASTIQATFSQTSQLLNQVKNDRAIWATAHANSA
jgi:HPt (histidine-containing phosphotransfer) domain-containing protein